MSKRTTPGRKDITHPAPGFPHDWETERALLACLLMDSSRIVEVSEHVASSDFSRPQNANLFDLITKITETYGACDLTLLIDHAQRSGVMDDEYGGASYIVGLANAAPTPEFGVQYAQKIRVDASLRRIGHGLLGALELVKNNGSISDVAAAINAIATDAMSSGSTQEETWRPMSDAVGEAFDAARTAYETGAAPVFVRTGIEELDELLQARPTDLIVVAARPAMGKSVFADQWAGHAASMGMTVGFLSLEMGAVQLGQRNLARASNIHMGSIIDGTRLGEHDIGALVHARDAFTGLPVYVDDIPGLNATMLRAKVLKLKRRAEASGGPPLGMVVVDYLQLADVDGGGKEDNRATSIARFTRMCKVMAKEYGIVFVLISQLNRTLESRTNKRPMPSDLRESGAIEQDADAIVFIYRDEVYDSSSADRGKAEIIIAKQRQGKTGSVTVPFDGARARFGNRPQQQAPAQSRKGWADGYG